MPNRILSLQKELNETLTQAIVHEDGLLSRIKVRFHRLEFLEAAIPDVSRKARPSELAKRLLRIVDLLTKSVKFCPEFSCERQYKHKDIKGEKVRLAVQYGFPVMLCPECLKKAASPGDYYETFSIWELSRAGAIRRIIMWIIFLSFAMASGLLLASLVSGITILFLCATLIHRENRTQARKFSIFLLTGLLLPPWVLFLVPGYFLCDTLHDSILRVFSGDLMEVYESIYINPVQITWGIMGTLGFIYEFYQKALGDNARSRINTVVLNPDSTLTFLQ
jgi:flagellar biosynthesis protein FliQ